MIPARTRAQRGAALLTAMITVALVATIAAAAMWQQWRAVEVEAAERARVQSSWILTGALDWGRLILQGDLNEDRRKPPLVDHLGEPWAVPLAEARLSTFLAAGQDSVGVDLDAFLSGQITDQHARLNIMNLASRDEPGARRRFQRLFDLLHLPGSELDTLQRSLVRARTQMSLDGADNAALLPRRVEELAWLGVNSDTLDALRPYITLLPLDHDEATRINLNTAGAEVLHAVRPWRGVAGAQRLIAERQQHYFASAQQAVDALGATATEADLGWATTASIYFEIRGRLRLDDVMMEEVALVRRQLQGRNAVVTPLWRVRTVLGTEDPIGG